MRPLDRSSNLSWLFQGWKGTSQLPDAADQGPYSNCLAPGCSFNTMQLLSVGAGAGKVGGSARNSLSFAESWPP